MGTIIESGYVDKIFEASRMVTIYVIERDIGVKTILKAVSGATKITKWETI